MEQAKQIIEALPSDNRAPAYTALMVVINTAANAFDQSRGPSPERLALIELIDQRISENKLVREDDLESKVQDWIESNLELDDPINDWMSNNFEDYLANHNIGDVINDWMSDNLYDRINDLELVIKVK
jgi:hypothetical protein